MLKVILSDSSMDLIISKSFEQTLDKFKVNFVYQKEQKDKLIVYINGNEKSQQKVMERLFFKIYDLIFLCAGRYPTLVEFNNEDLTNFIRKYDTSSIYKRTYFIYKKIDANVVCQKNIDKISEFNNNNHSLYSLGYLMCSSYDKVLWEHKLTLLLHIIDGVFNALNIDLSSAIIEFKKRFQDKYTTELDQEEHYIQKVFYLMKNYFFVYKDVSDSIIRLLNRKNQFSFLQAIEESRNWYSHMDNKKENSSRIKAGEGSNYYYIFIIISTIRQMILKEYFNFELNIYNVKESYACIHDELLKKIKNFNELFSDTYKFIYVFELGKKD